MKICDSCGTQTNNQAIFCPICGKKFDAQTNPYQNTVDEPKIEQPVPAFNPYAQYQNTADEPKIEQPVPAFNPYAKYQNTADEPKIEQPVPPFNPYANYQNSYQEPTFENQINKKITIVDKINQITKSQSLVFLLLSLVASFIFTVINIGIITAKINDITSYSSSMIHEIYYSGGYRNSYLVDVFSSLKLWGGILSSVIWIITVVGSILPVIGVALIILNRGKYENKKTYGFTVFQVINVINAISMALFAITSLILMIIIISSSSKYSNNVIPITIFAVMMIVFLICMFIPIYYAKAFVTLKQAVLYNKKSLNGIGFACTFSAVMGVMTILNIISSAISISTVSEFLESELIRGHIDRILLPTFLPMLEIFSPTTTTLLILSSVFSALSLFITSSLFSKYKVAVAEVMRSESEERFENDDYQQA